MKAENKASELVNHKTAGNNFAWFYAAKRF
jgi:hypothetical protein